MTISVIEWPKVGNMKYPSFHERKQERIKQMDKTKRVHSVKSWSMFYRDIEAGIRTSDIRLNDRRYAVGDIMELNEFDPVKFEYTGRKMDVEITYIQGSKSNPCAISQYALHDDYLVLSIRKLNEDPSRATN